MASNGRIIKGLDEFLEQMKTLRDEDIYKILNKAEIKALTKPRDRLAEMYGTWAGKNDLNQTEAQKSWRWRAKKHQPMHPIKESRVNIAHNIYAAIYAKSCHELLENGHVPMVLHPDDHSAPLVVCHGTRAPAIIHCACQRSRWRGLVGP